MQRSRFLFILLILIPACLLAWFVLASRDHKPLRTLPYYSKKGDTTGARHVVPGFVFTDQDGAAFSDKDLEGHIYVTEFFFTTCQSICPVMNRHLAALYSKYRHQPSLHFLSHTVDPETDSVATLKHYARSMGVNDSRWHFVTGNKQDLYRMARQGYLLDRDDGGSHDDFVHTQKFALVDADRFIRGYYDGTDTLDMVRLGQDIDQLLLEHEHRKKTHR